MLTYDMNARGKTPLYSHLAQCIRADIIDEKIACGEKLPSKRALATHLGVGVATVASAYDQLLEEGFIRAEERRGFFAEDISMYRQRPRASVLLAQATSKASLEPAHGVSLEPAHGASFGAAQEASPATPREASPTQECSPKQKASREEYFVDLKANRTSISLFPMSVWGRYMREALSLPTDSLLRTVPYNGLPELRSAIAGYLHRNRGMDVSPDNIIVGAGSEYLYGRLLQMFGPSITFATEDPGYKKFPAISEALGHYWKSVPIDSSGLSVEALEESGADVVHVSPANHFPTGIVMPIKRRLELFEWANRASKRYIIEDDYDSEFRYSGHPVMPLYAEDAADKVIYMNAFSKTMVPSLRISYMVLPPRLLKQYVDTMSFYACTVSSFEQYALARFIEDGHFERHINRTRNFYRKQRAHVIREAKGSPLAGIVELVEHNAGTHFLLRVHTCLTEEEVRARAAKVGLNVSMFGDYRHARVEGELPTLVINYAGIEADRVHEAIERLASIFPECGL